MHAYNSIGTYCVENTTDVIVSKFTTRQNKEHYMYINILMVNEGPSN